MIPPPPARKGRPARGSAFSRAVAGKRQPVALSGAWTLAPGAAAPDLTPVPTDPSPAEPLGLPVRLANDRYEGGAASYLDVITAQQSLLNAQRQAAQLVGQRMLVAVLLIKALGGGWCAHGAARTR